MNGETLKTELKAKILYICFLDFNNIDSGNALRPYKMYKAFENIGLNILLLATSQDKQNKYKRKKQIQNIIAQIDSFKPDICYYESPTLPIKYSFDYKLIKIIKNKNIPCAYFYRDFYFSFKKIVVNNTFKDIIHSLYMKILKIKTDLILKQFDIVYFPSEECFKYFKYKNMRVLPPAADAKIEYQFVSNNTALYVGGLAKRYGTELLEKAYKILNEQGIHNLILVCRQDDFEMYKHLKQYNYIKIVHASGNELKQYYDMASIALLPLEKNEYNNLAVAIKTFEYMSYGKAIIATSNSATKKIIDECKCGITCEFNAEDFAKSIVELTNNKNQLEYYSLNAYNSIQLDNNWDNRAKTVLNDLMVIKNEKK